ncbi:hypothetical protein GCM10025776_00300 [Corallincola platygyrae]
MDKSLLLLSQLSGALSQTVVVIPADIVLLCFVLENTDSAKDLSGAADIGLVSCMYGNALGLI